MEQQVPLEDYSVSNRGLHAGLIGTLTQIMVCIAEFEAIGIHFLLRQCSPQLYSFSLRCCFHVIVLYAPFVFRPS